MSSISFCLDKPSLDQTYILLRINHKDQRIVVSTGEKISPKFWDSKKQQAKRTGQFAQSQHLNIFLSRLSEAVSKILLESRFQDTKSTLSEIKEKIKEHLGKSEIRESSFLKVYEEFIRANETTKAVLSIKKYRTFQNHLEQFQREKKFELTFEKINKLFYDRISDFYYSDLEVNSNTFGKYVTVLKTFLNWASERGYNSNYEFRKFKAPKLDSDIVYLTDDNLEKLLALDLSQNTRLEKIRDVFCLSCFTGLRYSDIVALRKENVQEDHILIRTEKTRDVLNIPLVRKEAFHILNKYFKTGDSLPTISNQKMNSYVKELCKLADISEIVSISRYKAAIRETITKPKFEFVSTHTARRTFVTLSLEKGVRPEIVMQVTGHKTFNIMKKYIKLTSKVVHNEFNAGWNK